jgi:DNA anti-recombination protein RmuC
MFDLLKSKLIAIVSGVAVMLLLMVISLGALYNNQLQKTADVKSDLSALQSKYDEVQAAIEADKKNRIETDKKVAQSGQKFNDAKRSVEKFTGREAVLRAKPTLTEKMINKSFSSFTDEISCTTGDSTPCLRKP